METLLQLFYYDLENIFKESSNSLSLLMIFLMSGISSLFPQVRILPIPQRPVELFLNFQSELNLSLCRMLTSLLIYLSLSDLRLSVYKATLS